MVSPAIAVEGLRFVYPGGEYRLDISRLEVARGERVGLIGASGSGKTTLLHLVAGVLTPSAGRITIADAEIGRASETVRRKLRLGQIGMIFQEFELLEHLTVRENILLPYFLGKPTGDAAQRQLEEDHLLSLAERAGIADYLRRRPRRLSQGERQRVAICRALVTRPEIVLADEPTGNLDPHTTDDVLTIMLEEVAREKATLMMVTHDHSLLDRFDRVIDFDEFRSAAGSSSSTGASS